MILIYSGKGYAPTKDRASDAGWDLRSMEHRVLRPGEIHRFDIGIAIQFEGEGHFYGRLAPRSGLAANYGIDVLGGVIDRDYTAEIGVVLVNSGFFKDGVLIQEPWTVAPGDKICQIIPTLIMEVTECREGKIEPKRHWGFGSSGTS